MKFWKSIVHSCIAASVLIMSGCGKDDDPKPEEQVQLENLVKTWTLTDAVLGTTLRTDFVNVTLTISGSFNSSSPLGPYTYNLKGTFPNPSPWKPNGQWTFGEDAVTSVIVRDPGTADELVMNYNLSNDAKTLTINFSVPEAATGWGGGIFAKTKQVSGNWSFTFTSN